MIMHFGPFHQIFMPAKFLAMYSKYTILAFPLCFETTNQISLQSIQIHSSTATVCVKCMLPHSICFSAAVEKNIKEL